MSYSKLHSSLVNSSLWCEPDPIRILFVTFLAICDATGRVYGSRGGIARQANIKYPQPESDPFKALMSPDPDSSDLKRHPENEGRRIVEIEGGFQIVNYEFYRSLRNSDDRKLQNREAQRRFRSKNKPQSASVSHGKPRSAQAEAEAEAEKRVGSNASKKRSHPTPIDEDFLNDLQKDPTYKGVNVRHVFGKMVRHCSLRGKQPTRRRLVDWLNREDVPMQSNGSAQQLTKYGTPVPSRCTMDKNGNVYDYTGRMMDVNQVRAALKKI